MSDKHTDDLRNIWEGETVTIKTSEGNHFDAECTARTTEHAAENTGEVTQTTIWEFDAIEWRPVATITDGLESNAVGGFPKHSALWCRDQEQNLGYIETVQIYGPME